ncbi:MAG: DUF3164 family protein [Lentisphaerota bacterium]
MSKSQKIYTDATGQTVPSKYVKPYDKLRDRIARKIDCDWAMEQLRLAELKNKTLELVKQLQDAAATSAGVDPLGGKEGYIQFRSFDGLITIRVDNAKRTEFDERLQLAQGLIMEAVQEISRDAKNADLVEIATRAFQPRKSGNLDMQRIRDLKSYNVKHPKWIKAIEIINECERVIGHKRYIRVSVKANRDAEPENIILDIAAL